MKFRFLVLSLILFSIYGCSVQFNQSNASPNMGKSDNSNTPNVAPTNQKANESKVKNSEPTKDETVNSAMCYNLKRDDLMLDKKQTFTIDFKPFEKSCFVTFHNPEFDNPPLGSQAYIYTKGQEVFEFPNLFNGGNTNCWIDAVDFEDVNNDQLKDVILVGKCGAKSSDFNENMVYINTGEEFVTNVQSNSEMMDFSKVSQIKDFVKKNPNLFSK